MTTIDKVLYTAKTHSTGGRDGASRTSDGRLDVKLSSPGTSGGGTNPEQLFAAGWSACFLGALGVAAAQRKVTLPADRAIDAEVDLGTNDGGYLIRARLNVSLPGVDREVAQALVDAAHQICPYSKAILSLAETGEVLRLLNRSGNRPSHEGAAARVDQAIWLCMQAGFRRMVLRGDTDFSQTEHLDRWHALPGVHFVFGYDAMPNLKKLAEGLPATAWKPLSRPAPYEVPTRPRQRPDKVKDRIVRERGFEVLRLKSEEVAEFDYQPTACANTYRLVVIRKHISKEKGDQVLTPQTRHFFYITNDRNATAPEIVFEANDRCNQEVRHDNREGIADSVSRTLGRRCLSRPTYSPSKDERGTEPVGEAAVGVEVPGPTRRKACEAW